MRRLSHLRGAGAERGATSRLAAGGRQNREIAQALFVGTNTVEFHLRNAYRKPGIASRTQLSEALGPARDNDRGSDGRGLRFQQDPARVKRGRLERERAAGGQPDVPTAPIQGWAMAAAIDHYAPMDLVDLALSAG